MLTQWQACLELDYKIQFFHLTITQLYIHRRIHDKMSFCKKLIENNVNLIVLRQNIFVKSFRKIQTFMMRTVRVSFLLPLKYMKNVPTS